MASSAGDVFCIVPLASPYSFLPRIHTYAVAVALVLPLPKGWIFKAALAAFTTRTAVFAVDAAAHLAGLRRNPGDPAPLDALVASQALALASLVAIWLLMVSSKLDQSSARGIIRCWAATVGVGSILAFVAVGKLGQIPVQEGACQQGDSLTREEFLGDMVSVPVLGVMGWKVRWFLYRVSLPGIILGALALLCVLRPRPSVRDTRGYTRDKEAKEGRVMRMLRRLSWVTVPALAIFVTVSTEQYLHSLAPQIPSAEEMFSVGQWGVWAATGVVLLATLINWSNETTDANSGRSKANPEIQESDSV
ncbi:hypothetical protein BX600DRAFT_515032 [Xylariales sp. PMI_506]|nr:hypothetical protein BX600DRAFT_515032 [Xylariales sp. PMI_506]